MARLASHRLAFACALVLDACTAQGAADDLPPGAFTSGPEPTAGDEQSTTGTAGGSDTIDFYTASSSSSLFGRRKEGSISDGGLATQFSNAETVLANVRSAHNLRTDLDALDFVFKRIGTS